MSMTKCYTAVPPLLMHRRYCSLALNQQCNMYCIEPCSNRGCSIIQYPSHSQTHLKLKSPDLFLLVTYVSLSEIFNILLCPEQKKNWLVFILYCLFLTMKYFISKLKSDLSVHFCSNFFNWLVCLWEVHIVHYAWGRGLNSVTTVNLIKHAQCVNW